MFKVIFGILLAFGAVQYLIWRRRATNQALAKAVEELKELNAKEEVLEVREKVARRKGVVNKIETKVTKEESKYE